ncbi:hypothetical protein E5S70_25145 [Ensifer adhaerens]|nr:hypothetical protein [Ensifer canadensis]
MLVALLEATPGVAGIVKAADGRPLAIDIMDILKVRAAEVDAEVEFTCCTWSSRFYSGHSSCPRRWSRDFYWGHLPVRSGRLLSRRLSFRQTSMARRQRQNPQTRATPLRR